MNKNPYDVIVVGGGPAGLTAGIYAGREELSVLILEKSICGGWPNLTGEIENYPGFPEGINGMELADRFKAQAERFGAQIREFEPVRRVISSGETIRVETEKGEYFTRCLIVAPGSRMKQLGIPGEEELAGKGVSYCATCDGPLYRGKEVAVVGGGNAALEEALFLTRFASRVHLIHRRAGFRGEKYVVEQLKKTGKVNFVLESIPVSVNGERAVESLTVRDRPTGQEKKIAVAGVFIFVGVEPNTDFLRGTVDLDEAGFILADRALKTSISTIFVAGDARAGNIRQITAACGEGTAAALMARSLLVEY